MKRKMKIKECEESLKKVIWVVSVITLLFVVLCVITF